MPTYSFLCDEELSGCGTSFEKFILISDYDCEKEYIVCPKCGEYKSVVRDLLADAPRVFVKQSDSDIKLGHLAQRNNERFSDDEKADIIKRNNAYKESDTPLPDGMTRIKKTGDFKPSETKPKRKPRKKHDK